MDSEKGMIISFLSKITELILQMRYDNGLLAQAMTMKQSPLPQTTQQLQNSGDNQSIFGLSLSKQQYRMVNQISEKWGSSFTPITLEFFLQRKSDSKTQCVEQWQFTYEKDFGVASQTAGGKPSKKLSELKLTVLARAISSLLVQTPLWKHYICNQNRQAKNAYILDYKLSFSKNQPIHDSIILQSTDIQLSTGSMQFKCLGLNNLDEIVSASTQRSNSEINIAKACVSSGTTNSNSLLSTANSSPQANSSPSCVTSELDMNYCEPNFRRKNEQRERFLSEKIDPTSELHAFLNPQEVPQMALPPNPRERCMTMGASKNKLQSKQTNNNTFKFSFAENEPLSDEEKNMINQHLRKSSVVSVYSRMDDITIVSTPEEIASKMSDCPPSELNGLEIEMVLEEEPCAILGLDPIRPSRAPTTKKHQNRQDLYAGMSDEYCMTTETKQKQTESSPQSKELPKQESQQQQQQQQQQPQKEQVPLAVAADNDENENELDDDFDFQLIEDENDGPVDIAIKDLNNLINAFKAESRLARHSQSAFELYASLSKFVDNY